MTHATANVPGVENVDHGMHARDGMIRSLSVRNFMVFEDAKLRPSKGLNVFIGANGTGKSHLLKLAYVVARVRSEAAGRGSTMPVASKDEWQRAIAAKLVGVFRPQSLGRLVARRRGRQRCEVVARFEDDGELRFSFAANSKTEVKLDAPAPNPSEAGAVFLPTQELLSTGRGFAEAYRRRELDFDETYYDLALALEGRPLRGRPRKEIAQLSSQLEDLIGGRVQQEKSGEFSFEPRTSGRGSLEMPLVAEGFRKVGMLSHLLRNGSLGDQASLFWDEPETNLNPRMLHPLARVFVELASIGTQVFLVTHSLFFLRELEIALQTRTGRQGMTPCFVALARREDGAELTVGRSTDEITPIDMLEADLEQSDRYLALSE